MAANTIPIYTKAGQIGGFGVVLTTANTAMDGTGTVGLIFTAGADGGRIERLRVKALGTNVATVLRVFINNGNDPATAANNRLYTEATIAATTASNAAALALTEFPNTTDPTAFPLVLPASYRLYVTIGTTVAAGLHVTAIGGTY
ncbi:MAG: hypothetical protein ACP5N7_06015 [Candidatus Pacearchaeota archaeon]